MKAKDVDMKLWEDIKVKIHLLINMINVNK